MMEPAVQSGLTETVLQSVWSVLKPVPSHRSPALLRARARNKGAGAASYLCQATEDREVWVLTGQSDMAGPQAEGEAGIGRDGHSGQTSFSSLCAWPSKARPYSHI